MTATYPLPRETRQTSVLMGDGVNATYGPFAFKIFDVEDVEVWTRSVNGSWAVVTDTTVLKTSNEVFSSFQVTFSSVLANDTQFAVLGRRLHERDTDVSRGGALNSDALERELSKQTAVLEELRRDVDGGVRSPAGLPGPTIQPISEGRFWAADAEGNMVDGGSVADIQAAITAATSTAQDRAATEAARLQAQQAATSAAQSAATATGIKPYSRFADAFASGPIDGETIYFIASAAQLEGVAGRAGQFVYQQKNMASVLLGSAQSATIDAATNTLVAANHDFHTGQAVLVSQNLGGLSTNTLYYAISQKKAVLDFDAKTADFTVGQVVSGATSGATATVLSVTGTGATGQLRLGNIVGTFQNNEALTDPLGGSANAIWTSFDKRDEDRFKLAATFGAAISGNAVNLTANATVTVQQHCDPLQAIYVTRDDDLAGINGAFCRVRPDEETSDIRHFGAELQDIFEATQAAIFYQEFLSRNVSIPTQNENLGRQIKIPAGRWRCGGKIRVRQGGVCICGAAAGATIIQQTVFNSGFIEFRHPNSRDGQGIENNGLFDLTVTGQRHVFHEADVGARAVLCKQMRMQNVRIKNFSYMMILAAVQEPVYLSDIVLWQDNVDMRNGELLRVEVYNVQAGTPNARVNPDTGASLRYSSQIWMQNPELRTSAGTTKTCLVLQGVDGFVANTMHIIGGETQMRYACVSASVPISNIKLNTIFFDGTSETKRNLYIPAKTYSGTNADIECNLNNPKFNDANVCGLEIANEDVRDVIIHGGESDKQTGDYAFRITGGAEYFCCTDHKFENIDTEPNIAAISLMGKSSAFFRKIILDGNKFVRRRGNATLPRRYVLIDDDGTNTSAVAIHGNTYESDSTLVEGLVQHNVVAGTTSSVTVTDQNNVELAV